MALTRDILFERHLMGCCLYLYQDELPELEALAGRPWTFPEAVQVVFATPLPSRPPPPGDTLLVRVLRRLH